MSMSTFVTRVVTAGVRLPPLQANCSPLHHTLASIMVEFMDINSTPPTKFSLLTSPPLSETSGVLPLPVLLNDSHISTW